MMNLQQAVDILDAGDLPYSPANAAKVRVLVPDLYTETLNKLGTSVTYCQGDLKNQGNSFHQPTLSPTNPCPLLPISL